MDKDEQGSLFASFTEPLPELSGRQSGLKRPELQMKPPEETPPDESGDLFSKSGVPLR